MSTWPRHNSAEPPPIYWLKVPAKVIESLKPLGFHTGYWRIDGIDAKIKRAVECSTDEVEKIGLLREWITFVDREVSLLARGHATLWYPKTSAGDEKIFRALFGERLVEIEASTLEETMHRFHLTEWNFGVFYHVACMGNWRIVVEEQLGLLKSVGLSGVYLSFLGNSDELDYFYQRARAHGIKISLQYRHTALDMFEIPIMRIVQDWAKHNKNGYVLYFHTKGVSLPDNPYRILWRRVMQECVVRSWKTNAERLRAGTDIVGHYWQRYPLIDHVPGNFWMAKASFINRLEDFNHYCAHPRHPSQQNLPRFSAEFWLGSAARPPLSYSHIPNGPGIDRANYWDQPRPGTSGYLALCLWCKDEGVYLPEWIDYHLRLGVDHIFIIDNNSDDPLEKYILPNIAGGKVTLLRDNDATAGRQCRAYARCLRQFGKQYSWMGFIDTDEFIVPKAHQTLPELLADYEGVGGLGIFWYCFGSNGLKTRPDSVVRSFLKRSDEDFGTNDHIKSLVQPQYVAETVPGTPHHFSFKAGYCCVDENMQPIRGPRRRPRVSEKVQLNHYIIRSEAECQEKLQRGPGNGAAWRRSKDFFDGHDRQCNRVYDASAVVIMDRLIGSGQ